MRSSITLMLLPALVAASTLGYAVEAKVSRQDAKAIRNLAEANRAEVDAGKLALQKARSEDVKKFAQHMVDDHGRMLEEVQQLAESKGIKLPDGVGVKNKAQEKKLEMASGDKFDKDYIAAMVKDHQTDLKELQKISKNAKDPELKAAADKAASTVKQHFEMAKQMSSGPRAGK
jgi:putative membrane protein